MLVFAHLEAHRQALIRIYNLSVRFQMLGGESFYFHTAVHDLTFITVTQYRQDQVFQRERLVKH